MAKEKVIIISAGGIDSISPDILLQLNKEFGEGGYVIVDPKDVKNHATKAHVFERSLPIINVHEHLPEIKLKEPSRPIDAILIKNKRRK